ncbi:MAG: DUF4040 domain-containing protein [Pseudomonadota bacterium]
MINFALLAMLLLVAVALLRLRDLFTAAMLTGIYSLVSACFFMVQDAVDVAFTEAAVGAGITTVLFLATLSMVGRDEAPISRIHLPALACTLACGALLVYASQDMPAWGDPNAPVHQHVAPRYIEHSADEVGPPNIVTSVLASYRSYDTMGEVGVVFTAAIGVLLLLGNGTKRRRTARREPEDSA